MPAGATSSRLAVAVMADDLASGFQSVDAASDFEVFANCLTLIDSLPFFAECKRESYVFTSYTGFLVSGNRPVH